MKKDNKNIEKEIEEIEVSEAVEAAEETAKPEKAKKFNKRNFKHGTMSVILTVVFVAAVILVNVIVGLISERFETDVDLSSAGMYTLDEETEDYLMNVDKEVTITVLNSESNFEGLGDAYKQVNELLKKMQLANPLITIEYKPLDQNPAYASQPTTISLLIVRPQISIR